MRQSAAARQHRAGVAAADDVGGRADGVGARGAGRADRRHRAAQAELDRHLPGAHVRHAQRDGEGRHPVGPALEHHPVLLLARDRAGPAVRDDRPDPGAVVVDREARVGDGQAGRGHRELRVPVHPPRRPPLHEVGGVEAVGLAGHPHRGVGGVEEGDQAGAGAALGHGPPHLLAPDAERGHHADAGHRHAGAPAVPHPSTAASARTALWPPKPKEFDRARRTEARRRLVRHVIDAHAGRVELVQVDRGGDHALADRRAPSGRSRSRRPRPSRGRAWTWWS